ncbi:glycosylphosphatidylinositol anchor attachment 1 protein isoform X1 [Lingula anatina]|uniref:GPI-anchor transamidase component GPAA1 n=1 Tax=Lingula anatina TaxID=7574 RepID=A0A1S3K866_LINAN|nr:glycosylphosphatidylinositol anchor attachment 1 protein isoform X1 [Lingula anatina]|eukprot:XP_013418451.1 glycosylphosphatidylinositol anchor attachment 1 protein isoform X1 [Lingula anatina]
MGLLTNPTSRATIVGSITRHNNKICFLCYVVGLSWFLALAYQELNAGTYFSENALLPGLVRSQFYGDSEAEGYYSQLKSELNKDKNVMPVKWIYNQFMDLGLDVYIHNFTFRYPLKIFGEKQIPGQNVYAIMRASRAASTEALVLTIPFRTVTTVMDKTHGGLALMLTMANHFRKSSYWAKDIIFVVTEHEYIGMQAWLDAYHETKSELISSNSLEGHGGSIQAAINLEVPTNKISSFDFRLEGLNGQLPNLDLFNLVVRISRQEGFDVLLKEQHDPYHPETFEGYLQNLKTMFLMMWTQAPGSANNNHGVFLKYNIEALTLVGKKEKGKHAQGYGPMGRTVEGIFRSLNNLLERFHQSFFFYLLPSTSRYVSIGLYMPPFAIMVAGSLIKAVAMWISCTETVEEGVSTEKEKKETDQANGESVQKNEVKDHKEEKEEERKGLLSVIPILFITQLFGLLAYFSPDFFVDLGMPLHLHVAEAVHYGMLALFLSSLAMPRFLKRSLSEKSRPDWKLLKCVSLIVQGLVLFSIALMNISLAFFLAAVMVPVCVAMWPSNNRVVQILHASFLLLISPFLLLYITVVANQMMTEKVADVASLLVQSWDHMKTPLILGMVESQLLGSWTYCVICLGIFPNWLAFWCLIWIGS